MKNSVVIVETERLILRRYKESDLEDLYEYLSNPKVVEFEPYQPMTFEEVQQELKERISSDEMIAVELKENHKLIGNVYLGKRDFHALEMGYVFNDAYWNRGYARESCMELMNLAFEHGVHRIYAECDPENKNSSKLLEALGFTREAHLRKNVYFWCDENGEPIWKDNFIYGKLRDAGCTLQNHILTDAEKREICSWKYSGDYAVYNLPSYEVMKEKQIGFFNPEREQNYRAFYVGDSLIGFVNIKEEDNQVFIGIGVKPELCSRGYGQRILHETYRISKELHPDKLLYLEVRTWNERAIRCYQRAGFEIVGESFKQQTGSGVGTFYRMIKL